MPGTKRKSTNYELFPVDPGQQSATEYKENDRHANIIKSIFSNLGFSSHLLSPSFLGSLLVRKDVSELMGLRLQIQGVLNRLFTQEEILLDCCNVKDKLNQKEILINNILSYYAFTEPLQNESLRVPTKVDGEWKMIEYRVDKIRLTSPVFSDPYYAYGLVPQHPNQNAGSKILYMGTNRTPTANGSRYSKFVDVIPGQSVGELLYRIGRNKIESWINEQYLYTKKKVTAIGTSMGGSVSLITHIENPDKVNSVAFNPPALLPHMSRVYKKRLNGKKPAQDAIKIYTQKLDFVPYLGVWFPENALMYRFTANKNFTPNKFNSHVKSYIAMDPSSIKRIFPAEKNGGFRRWAYTIVWQMVCVPFFFWNLLYMGLKALVYPANLLVGKMVNDPGYVEDYKVNRQEPWQKAVSIF